jgi:hypothetical protein
MERGHDREVLLFSRFFGSVESLHNNENRKGDTVP